jgi:hypothetical protein
MINSIPIDFLDFFSKINIEYSNISNYLINNQNFRKNIPINNSKKENFINTDNWLIIKKLFLLSFLEGKTDPGIRKIDDYLNLTISTGLGSIINKKNNGWVYCDESCIGIRKLFEMEIESTLYILNIISNSLVSIDNNSYVTFKFTGSISDLTGIWDKDKDKFELIIYNNDGIMVSLYQTRLIMGFGPSASGKTYCAKAIITMLSKNDPDFPKSFLSIDGGIYREKSYIYQKVIKLIKPYNFNGLRNLVLSGLNLKTNTNNLKITKRKSLFDSSIVKNKVIKYLETGNNVSLYVPETLGGCFSLGCKSSYEKYINIANDKENWIGLLIWQHKTDQDCDYKEAYKCMGCTKSGTKREKNEGKKYSSTAWENSMLNGRHHMMLAPGGKYEIHNGGGKEYYNNKEGKNVFSKSVIINHSNIGKNINIQNGFILYNKTLKNNSKKTTLAKVINLTNQTKKSIGNKLEKLQKNSKIVSGKILSNLKNGINFYKSKLTLKKKGVNY